MGYGVFDVSYSVCVKIRFSGHILGFEKQSTVLSKNPAGKPGFFLSFSTICQGIKAFDKNRLEFHNQTKEFVYF